MTNHWQWEWPVKLRALSVNPPLILLLSMVGFIAYIVLCLSSVCGIGHLK